MNRRSAWHLALLALALPSAVMAQAGGLKSEIAKLSQAWQTAYNAGDAAAVAALYAEDAMLLPPGHDAASGRAAIQDFFKQDIAAGAKNTLTTNEVTAAGDFVIEVGGYVATGADGSHLDHGKYVTVFKKVGGAWKIFRDTWNSSMSH